MIKLIQGDCLERLKELPANSVDSIVTDPPYGLEFMGKHWDKGVPDVAFWTEMLRVLKPGGHLLSFSGTRTYHRMATAIEDAGFEVRDMIEWVYGSGFPKSLNIGKAVDKLQGNERVSKIVNGKVFTGSNNNINGEAGEYEVTKGTSEWEGWGTALKPAHEPICMARKPLAEKTIAENCLKWGTGGINIDESRVKTSDNLNGGATTGSVSASEGWDRPWRHDEEKVKAKAERAKKQVIKGETLGRFPANLIHDNSEEVRECFPETKSGGGNKNSKDTSKSFLGTGHGGVGTKTDWKIDSGNASRFFKSIIYQAKASKSERNKGCEGLEEKQYSHDGRDKEIENPYQRNKSVATNNHPTVKPIALMSYLIKMVTPPGGTTLDPFMGSGSTGVAAKQDGFSFIGIEMEEEYIEIAKARIDTLDTK